jgi:hypothetical protein
MATPLAPESIPATSLGCGGRGARALQPNDPQHKSKKRQTTMTSKTAPPTRKRRKTQSTVAAKSAASKHNNCRYSVGLDLSLASPGMSVLDRQEKHLHLACFAQRKREIGGSLSRKPHPDHARVTSWALTVLDPVDKKTCDGARYSDICKRMLDQLLCAIVDTPEDCQVFVEQYAFGASGSSMHKLQELGGVVKARLFTLGFHHVVAVAVGTWKKRFCGQGNASKADVHRCTVHVHGLPDPMTAFPLLSSRPPAMLPLTAAARGRDPPNPVQDMLDALGLLPDFKFIAPRAPASSYSST